MANAKNRGTSGSFILYFGHSQPLFHLVCVCAGFLDLHLFKLVVTALLKSVHTAGDKYWGIGPGSSANSYFLS